MLQEVQIIVNLKIKKLKQASLISLYEDLLHKAIN